VALRNTANLAALNISGHWPANDNADGFRRLENMLAAIINLQAEGNAAIDRNTVVTAQGSSRQAQDYRFASRRMQKAAS